MESPENGGVSPIFGDFIIQKARNKAALTSGYNISGTTTLLCRWKKAIRKEKLRQPDIEFISKAERDVERWVKAGLLRIYDEKKALIGCGLEGCNCPQTALPFRANLRKHYC